MDSGIYTADIVITDELGGKEAVPVTFTVKNVNPTAKDDAAATDEDTPITVTAGSGSGLLDNDTDPIDPITATAGTFITTQGASLKISTDGSYIYDPTGSGTLQALDNGDSLADTYLYTVKDDDGGSATATVTITVGGVNDAPEVAVVIADQASNDFDTIAGLDVSGNFSDADDTLSNFTATGLPNGLSIALATGVISGTLDKAASQSSPWTVTVRATDDNAVFVEDTFQWDVSNPAPTATANTAAVTEDGGALQADSGNVITDDDGSGVDSDPDGDSLSVTLVNGAAVSPVAGTYGSLTWTGDGSYTYTLNNAAGVVQALDDGDAPFEMFSYTVSDGEGGLSVAGLTVTINGANDAPVVATAIADQADNDADVISLDVSGNFSDVDTAETMTFSDPGTTLPTGLSISPAGIISGTLDKAASQSSPWTVTVRATDDSAAFVEDTFQWDVSNPAPTATANTAAVTEDGGALQADSGNVITDDDGSGADNDPDGDSLSVTLMNGAAVSPVAGTYGSLTWAGDGSYTYTLNNAAGVVQALDDGEAPTEAYTYTLSDGDGVTTTATLTVTINGANDAPVVATAIADQADNDADVISLDVSGNFSDVDTAETMVFSDPGTTLPTGLSISPAGIISGTLDKAASQSSPWTVTVRATDDSAAFVEDTFQWDVSNPAPTATANTAAVTEDGGALQADSGNVITDDDGSGVDSDPDGDSLSVTLINGVVTNPAAGSYGNLTWAGDGSYTYTLDNANAAVDALDNGDTLSDVFTYTLSDGEGGTDPAQLTVTINGANDAPVMTAIPDQTIDEDTLFATIDLDDYVNDVDSAHTDDQIVWTKSGATDYVVTIDPVTHVATIGIPYTDWNGSESITFRATDPGGLFDEKTAAFTVTAVNDAPSFTKGADQVVAEDAGPQTVVGWATAIDAGAPNESSQSLAFIVSSDNGSLFAGLPPAIDANGTLTYTPVADASGTATLTVSLTDDATAGGPALSTANQTFTITVNPVNDPPTLDAIADPAAIGEDAGAQTVSLSGIDEGGGTYEDSQTLSVTATSSDPGIVPDPTVTYTPDNATGSIAYTPVADANGSAVITVTVTDSGPNGGLDVNTTSRQFSVTINPVNDPPNAVDDSLTTDEDSSQSGNVLTNDAAANPDSGETLTVSAYDGTSTKGASITLNTTSGAFTYDPTGVATFQALDDGESLGDSFGYTVSDGVFTDTAVVAITVSGVNDPPVTVNDAATTDEDTVLTVNAAAGVLANDSDVDGDPLTVAVYTSDPTGKGAAFGIAADGSYTYNPTVSTSLRALAVGESDAELFTYTASDGTTTATGQLTITIEGVNDAPIPADDVLVISEDATSGNLWSLLLANDTEYDTSDTLTIAAVDTTGTAGTVSFNAGTQTLTYAADVFEYLGGSDSATTRFDYAVDDGHVGSFPSGTVNITVQGQNDPPVAVDDVGSTFADTVLSVSAVHGSALLQNDSDPDASAALFVSAADTVSAQGAVVTVNGDGSYVYNPTGAAALQAIVPGDTLDDTFAYTVSDGGLTDTATVTITVGGADEGGEAFPTADPIACGGTIDARINPKKDKDYYRFELFVPTAVTIHTISSKDTRTILYDVNGNQQIAINGKNKTIERTLDPGIWYIRVDDKNGKDTQTYTTSLTCVTGDASNSCPATAPIACGSVTSAAIDANMDVDYYQLDLSAATGPQEVVIYTASAMDTVGEIKDADCITTIAADDNSGTDANFYMTAALNPGVYNVQIRNSTVNEKGDYDLYVECTPDDFGDDCTTAAPIGCGSSINGNIETAGDVDYFQLVLPDSREVTLTSGGTTDVTATLYADDCSSSLATDDNGGTGDNFSIVQTLGAGAYYLAVTHAGGGTGAYTLDMGCSGLALWAVAFATDGNGELLGQAVQSVTEGGSAASVTADPFDGYAFLNWTATDDAGVAVNLAAYGIADITAPTITVANVDQTLYLTAHFSVITRTVTFAAGSNGALTGALTQTVNYGGSTSLVTAAPDPNYYFLGWSGDYTGTSNPLVVTNVTEDMNLTATFGTALTVNFIAGANGSITGDLTQTVLPGQAATAVSALPAAHYHFGGWSGDYVSMDETITVTGVVADMDITANFEIDEHAVKFIAGEHGSISGDANQNVAYGGDATAVTAVADTDYSFEAWSGDYTGTDNPLTITNVTEDMQFTASFKKDFYTITATVGIADGDTVVRGTISPAGDVSVAYGTDQEFVFTPHAGYTIARVLVDGSEAQILGTSYTFLNVRDEHVIEVIFDVELPLAGCGTSLSDDSFNSGFTAADRAKFDLTKIDVSAEGTLALQTGNQYIDIDEIVVPFTQEVAVTFLAEFAGGFKLSDFGWMLASEGVNGTKHEIYADVNDNNNNGVLDVGPTNTADSVGDINDDGVINAKDNRVVLGTFAGGTELVFYLKVDNRGKTFYTKKAWNEDTWDGDCAGSSVTKTYRLGKALTLGGCQTDNGWLDSDALTRLEQLYGFEFIYDHATEPDDTQVITVTRGDPFDHVIVGAPGNKPNEWILGWEDLPGGGDTDLNDLVFHIERQTGGTVRLDSDNAIVPADETAYFTAVTFEVIDSIPCSDANTINYYLSIDNGGSWVEVTDWDEIRASDAARSLTGDQVDNWVPGNPRYTYRTVRIDFAERGYSGRELTWRAEMISDDETCVPEILAVNLDGAVANNGIFARASVVTQTNMLYSGTYETPAGYWSDKTLRGHLTATRIYDPAVTTATDALEIWDAGAVLTDRDPDTRTIYFPDITVTDVANEQLYLEGGFTEARGDGTTTTFRGTLAHAPVSATSVLIYDGATPEAAREKFADIHTEDLDGNLGGSGTLNRFTGQFEVTFNTAPDPNVPIVATYAYYTTNPALKAFNTTNVTSEMLGLQRGSYIIPDGFEYDFDGDDKYNNVDKNGLGTADDSDGDWLVQWVRGWANPDASPKVKKEWLLGPLDHSVPAVQTPPGRPKWYFGTGVSSAEREAFDTFRTAQENRRTVVYVGAKDGMLHAFDAGQFRWGDNDKTSQQEARGYFLWDDMTAECPLPADGLTTGRCFGVNGKTCSECPDYGTGDELWAFIPANVISRLKNNLAKGDDQAYVDASPTLADVYIDTDLTDVDETNSWRTVLLSAEGIGGDTVFCLDVTDPDNPTFMWEFADPDLFRSRSSPSVAQIGRIVLDGEARWVAFFVSGKTYDDTLYPSIYMIDIETGSVLNRIFLDVDSRGLGGVPSGQPALVDSDNNGYIDRIYIGSDKGLMYKVSIPDDPDALNYSITHCVLNTDFSDPSNNIVPINQRYHPIYASPTVVVENSFSSTGEINYNIRVFFGTGDSPYFDENINTADTTYHFFAYVDHSDKGECVAGELDWFLELPAGHRVFASAFAAAGVLYFGTSTAETEDPCDSSGTGNDEGRIFALDLDDGASLLNEAGQPGVQVGNIRTTPLVEDEHLYFRTSDGLISVGSGEYNNETTQGGFGQTGVSIWREIF